jgi:mannose-1-phosphate guanylyltransferase / mannose-6-phosphate isomerase
MKPIIPIILSGGAGSRLWPLSTELKPKQFHKLASERTMFAETLERVVTGDDVAFGVPMVVCGARHETQVLLELDASGSSHAKLVLEPMARNTAPALAAAALVQAEIDPDALMLVLPADHVIERPLALRAACLAASEAAQNGLIVTFAIVPTGPEIGYGYIKTGAPIGDGVYKVAAFREKPDLATAQAYVNSGEYAWNAGIFLFRASALIAELDQLAPEILAAARLAVKLARRAGNSIHLDAEAFSGASSKSIDYAVMESTENAAVVPVDLGWSDVGSYATLWEIGQKDSNGNVTFGTTALFDTTNCLAQSHTLPVALIGVSDLVVVVSESGILVTSRERAQDVRLASEAFK